MNIKALKEYLENATEEQLKQDIEELDKTEFGKPILMENKKDNKMKNELLICGCNDPEHLVLFLPWEETDKSYKAVFMEIHLVKEPFFRRLKYGLKYIFGYQCKYGAFDEIIIEKDNYQPLKEVVKFIEEE